MSTPASNLTCNHAIARLLPALLVTTLISLGLTINTRAAEPSMDEVVVKALRLPSTREESGTSMAIISNTLIKERGYVFALDALGSASGVTINQNGAYGGQANVRIRGAGSEQTLVLIDGVTVNDTTSPGGGFDFSAIDVDDIDRIEVLKGPQSTLWGSDAIGGVVNIITERPAEGFGADAFVEAGSHATRRVGGNLAAAGEPGTMRLSATRLDSDGISKADVIDGNSEADGFESTTFGFSGALNLPAEARLSASYRRVEADTEFDGYGFVTGVIDADNRSETLQSTGQIALLAPAFDHRLLNTLTLGHAELERENYTDGASSYRADGQRQLARYTGALTLNDNHQLSLGIEREDTETGADKTRAQGLFLLYKLAPLETLAVTFGVRNDDHDTFGEKTTGRVTSAWTATEQLTLRASWGQGFKAPTIFQTTFFCCGATAVNPNIVAETSDAWDLSAEYQLAAGSISLSYFQQDTDNLITFSFPIGGYENIAQAESRGVELDFTYALSESLNLGGNATYTDLHDGNGNRLVNLPRLAADVSLAWRPTDALVTTFMATYNGDELGGFFGNLPSWSRFDMAARYQLTDTFEVYGRLENLFDKQYQQVYGYGTPGRSGHVGVRYAL